MKTIVIATDGSPSAHEAVEFGLDLAAEQKADAVLVHVAPAVDLLPTAGFGMSAAQQHELTDEDRRSLEDAKRSRPSAASRRGRSSWSATRSTSSSPTRTRSTPT